MPTPIMTYDICAFANRIPLNYWSIGSHSISFFDVHAWLCLWISRRHPVFSLEFPRYDLKEYSEGSPVGDLTDRKETPGAPPEKSNTLTEAKEKRTTKTIGYVMGTG